MSEPNHIDGSGRTRMVDISDKSATARTASAGGAIVCLLETLPGFRVLTEFKISGPTGVEMEALTAVSVTCLALFDRLKAIDKTMEIGAIRVLEKEGGRSGSWRAE